MLDCDNLSPIPTHLSWTSAMRMASEALRGQGSGIDVYIGKPNLQHEGHV